jgi:uncharacterized membrane protein (DUF485 family)
LQCPEEQDAQEMGEKRARFSVVVLAVFLIFQISLPVGAQYLTGSRNVPVVSHSEVRSRVAVVKPVFTATAYSSFYTFYAKYVNTPKRSGDKIGN